MKRNAVRLGCESIIVSATCITGIGGTGFELHAVDGRWMLASYDEYWLQYVSSDWPGSGLARLYAWAPTLGRLRAKGVRTYLTPARALATVKS